MIAALYIRVSTAEQQLHGYSLEAQEKLLRDYADRNSMTVYGLYADRGKSANKALSKRTELLRMVNDAEAGRFDIILFKDITRWSRNSAQYYSIQDRLDKANVSWLAVEQPYLETRTPTGRFQVTVMLGTAQLESENTSQRIRFVQEHRAAAGGVLSGHVPLGYKIANVNGMKRLVKNESEQGMIEDLFQYYYKVRNQAKTIDYIRDKYGKHIWQSAFSSLLRNPIYKGEYRGNTDYCEPYISPTMYDNIQVTDQVRYGRKRSGQYIFRSLIRCPECGHVMTGNWRLSGGEEHLFYRCSYHHTQHICGYAKTHRQDRIEQQMLDRLAEILDRTELTDAANDLQNLQNQTDEREERQRQIEKLNRKLLNLKELFIDGDIDKASYLSRRDALKREISRLESVDDKSTIHILNLSKTPWETLYFAKNSEERGEWWRFVLERIDIVGGEYVPIFRNYA